MAQTRKTDYVKVKRTRFDQATGEYLTETIEMQLYMFEKLTGDEDYKRSLADKSVAVPIRFELIEEEAEKPKSPKAPKEPKE